MLGNKITERFNSNVLHFDATGSVVATNAEYARVFLYSIVMPVPIKGEPALPVFEWLSDVHNAVFITKRLDSWLRTVKDIFPKPHVIVTDASWALLHATTEAFNGTSLLDQINIQWDVMNGQHKQTTILRLCCSHYLHAIARKLTKTNVSKKVIH